MRNLKFTMAYCGRRYHGFQIQPNDITIQGTVEAALYQLTKEKICIIGCGRTDAGVHALAYVFNAKMSACIPCAAFAKALNAVLPDDIVINGCEEVSEDFHSRFSATGKEYVYRINTSEYADPFSAGTELHYPYSIDVPMLNKAARLFIGSHDFASYCTAESKKHLKSTVRAITSFDVEKTDSIVTFTVRGGGFLHNMVRILAGTLIYVNEGKRTLRDIEQSLSRAGRELAGKTLPPGGLYLRRVFYTVSV